jgi:hypothetical protein
VVQDFSSRCGFELFFFEDGDPEPGTVVHGAVRGGENQLTNTLISTNLGVCQAKKIQTKTPQQKN